MRSPVVRLRAPPSPPRLADVWLTYNMYRREYVKEKRERESVCVWGGGGGGGAREREGGRRKGEYK